MNPNNHVQLYGRLASQPEITTLTDGTSLARVRLYPLTTSAVPDEPDGPQSFHLVAWHRLASLMHQELRRGDRIQIQGELRNRRWVQAGRTQVRTEIHVRHFIRSANSRTEYPPSPQPANSSSPTTF
ncbi:single-stranded DNA-binding protein [Lewinella sp. 4G2]|uniref:single-stranded DNA-binding protein n=1 Tax=Lewinella sp. 4G2 TaxID=1803372 RepID=UPI0009782BF5|nr:single-stranded DNA-binding protein [Lewinella sp. 4G2]